MNVFRWKYEHLVRDWQWCHIQRHQANSFAQMVSSSSGSINFHLASRKEWLGCKTKKRFETKGTYGLTKATEEKHQVRDLFAEKRKHILNVCNYIYIGIMFYIHIRIYNSGFPWFRHGFHMGTNVASSWTKNASHRLWTCRTKHPGSLPQNVLCSMWECLMSHLS